ncbi:FAD-binding domain-containing protein [Aquimarina addita]|uniref:FAD-binding domain-containing protein n=1 Tax=Aquimarina addita TaxID=870485 RepID=A0ABP7XFY1_9FLAO
MNDSHTLYWLKKDFRLFDNPALHQSLIDSNKVTPVFIMEDSFLESSDTSAFHVQALLEALFSFKKVLQSKGGELLIIRGEVIETFEKLHASFRFNKIYAHQETGTFRTYQRDIAVRNWCQKKEIDFKEPLQTAVFRNLSNRDTRHTYWKEFTFEKLIPIPKKLSNCIVIPEWYKFETRTDSLTLESLGFSLSSIQKESMQKVSEKDAFNDLDSFLHERGLAYRGGISSPLTAFQAGSRTSVHLAYGTITSRTIYQKTLERMEELKLQMEAGVKNAGKWRMSLRSFLSRLHWRDHFIQRLETEPSMEFEAINLAYEKLEYNADPKLLSAWQNGNTGFPMVDASIRCLNETGFINFRMRAMITSFACHTLQISWKDINCPMAKMYTDYEPGIHLSQLQMQASVVGINTVRIYNPNKQIIDQDPDTIFIKKFVPELKKYSSEQIILHKEETLGNYPPNIVDYKISSAEMRQKIYAIRKTEGYREIADAVYKKHGSRKKSKTKNRKKEK